MNNNHHEDLPWFDHELSIREFHQNKELDYEKLSADYGRSVISGLLFLNAGALAILPAIASLLDKQCLSPDERLGLVLFPAKLFAAGAFFALLSGFFAYINYQLAVAHTDYCSRIELAVRRKSHPAYEQIVDFAKLIDREMKEADAAISKYWSAKKRFALLCIACGLVAFTMFSWACFSLFAIRCGI